MVDPSRDSALPRACRLVLSQQLPARHRAVARTDGRRAPPDGGGGVGLCAPVERHGQRDARPVAVRGRRAGASGCLASAPRPSRRRRRSIPPSPACVGRGDALAPRHSRRTAGALRRSVRQGKRGRPVAHRLAGGGAQDRRASRARRRRAVPRRLATARGQRPNGLASVRAGSRPVGGSLCRRRSLCRALLDRDLRVVGARGSRLRYAGAGRRSRRRGGDGSALGGRGGVRRGRRRVARRDSDRAFRARPHGARGSGGADTRSSATVGTRSLRRSSTSIVRFSPCEAPGLDSRRYARPTRSE